MLHHLTLYSQIYIGQVLERPKIALEITKFKLSFQSKEPGCLGSEVRKWTIYSSMPESQSQGSPLKGSQEAGRRMESAITPQDDKSTPSHLGSTHHFHRT